MSRIHEVMRRLRPSPHLFDRVPLVEPGLRSAVWKSSKDPYNGTSITIDHRNGPLRFSATRAVNGIFHETKLDEEPDGTFSMRVTLPKLVPPYENSSVTLYKTLRSSISYEDARRIVRNSILKAKRI